MRASLLQAPSLSPVPSRPHGPCIQPAQYHSPLFLTSWSSVERMMSTPHERQRSSCCCWLRERVRACAHAGQGTACQAQSPLHSALRVSLSPSARSPTPHPRLLPNLNQPQSEAVATPINLDREQSRSAFLPHSRDFYDTCTELCNLRSPSSSFKYRSTCQHGYLLANASLIAIRWLQRNERERESIATKKRWRSAW